MDATKEYVINVEDELQEQMAIAAAIQKWKLKALKDYHTWLSNNGFNRYIPNPTNECVGKYYGVKPLWKTPLSQGIVVKAENEDDYFIVMECSRLNEGYKYTQMILTLGGCLSSPINI